jgi:predicted chitinase
MVNGKVILKVKSGPGVIIGDTERDIIDNEVKFTGIEFDEPGDYVISVTSTSPDVDNTEFSVKVLPEKKNLEQPKSPDKDDSKPEEIPKPIIGQVDKASVDLPAMEFDKSFSKDDKLVASQIGITPFVNYMGSPINDRDISSLRLFHDGIIPVVQITFRDSNNTIKSLGFPQDDTKFEVFFNSRSNNLKSIHLKFKIEEFTTLKSGNYSMYGTLDISELYRMKYQTYNGTSYEALRNISKELKLGFNSNITNTDDKMPWRNVGDYQYVFIDNIIKHSYISDQSYMVGFIDYYYCFNYVDVEKEMKRDNKDDKCINTGGIPDDSTDDTRIVPLQLSTDKAENTSNTFIVEKNFENNSTSLSLKEGYKTKTKYYDKTKKMFLIFDVDSTTSDESKSLILKGAKGDKEAFDNNITTTYAGKIDTDNVHKNYNYAITQNKINIDNLNKMVLTVEVPNLNFSLYLYQKVKVLIVNQEPATETNKETVQWRKSGDYIISEINFNWNGTSLKQELKLIRKELGKNPEEINEGTPPTAPKDVKDPKQENPAPPSDPVVKVAPNSVYVVSDVYTVENSDGNRFLLTVTNVLANGTDITAKISQINAKSGLTTPITPIDGEFLFNTETPNRLIGNSNIGEVAIVGKGEIYENTNNAEIEEDVLDSEYTENTFNSEEEQTLILQQSDEFVVVNSESTNNIKGYDPENPDDSLSTNTDSKYPISKNTDGNIKKIMKVAKESGITNKYAIAAMLAICKKESGFIPQNEASYSGTKAVNIKKIFSKFRKYSDSEVDTIKKNHKQFFDIIYGGRYGNGASEGFKYRGRGLNQITFKGNYEAYKKLSGYDIINDPDLLNTIDVAAKCLVEYFKSNFKQAGSAMKSKYNFTNINSFEKLDDAMGAFYHANAGFGTSYGTIIADATGGRAKAFKYVGPIYNTYLKG